MTPDNLSLETRGFLVVGAGWRGAARAAALMSMLMSPLASSADSLKERLGYAYDSASGAMLYTEHHQEWWNGGQILRDTVTYRDAQGGVIGEKHVDFRSRENAPEFLLRNIRTGHAEGARTDSRKVEVSFRKSHGEPLKREALELPQGAIVDAGFDRFVENNWEALIRGETFVQPFLVPSRLQFMDFRLVRIDDGSDPERATFEMAIDSALLRFFAPPITVVYSTRDQSLLEYDGVSNLRNARGENLDVEIRFDPSRTEVSAASLLDSEHGAVN
jgi:hypothetical protein